MEKRPRGNDKPKKNTGPSDSGKPGPKRDKPEAKGAKPAASGEKPAAKGRPPGKDGKPFRGELNKPKYSRTGKPLSGKAFHKEPALPT